MLGAVMSTHPPSQRRHAAGQARVATALLSLGGFVGIIGAMAATRTTASTTAPVPAETSAPTAPAPATTTAPVQAPVQMPVPVPTIAPATSSGTGSSGASRYAGTPAQVFNQQPVTRSYASR